MENLDAFFSTGIAQSQLLRMTFKNTDYSFRIIKPIRFSDYTQEIDIILGGITHTLLHKGGMWAFKDPQDHDADFATALGRTIWLRYRF